jgi:hypothetical protein
LRPVLLKTTGLGTVRYSPGFLTGARSETAERAVDARKATEAIAGVVLHCVEVADRV